MALTKGNWSKYTANNITFWECDVTQTTGENDNYTKVIDFIDPMKPWILMVNTAGASLDDAALPVDIWGGWTTAGLTGNDTTVAWTSADGGEIASAVIDDVKTVGNAIVINPNYTGAKVQSTLAGVRGVVAVPAMPYYAINCDGAGALLAATCHYVVIQQQ